MNWPLLQAEVQRHPYSLLFATISGAHLYGFPSPDSDFDLRGVHILPAQEALGLMPKRETITLEEVREGVEIDLVTHDVLKFFGLLLKRNGYVLEQLHSPLVVHSTPEHEELRAIAQRCVTRNHSHHYLGFASTQWKLFDKGEPRRIKPLLYTYRVLLTGVHLMRTGRIEANLGVLNREFRLPQVDELIARKTTGAEQTEVDDIDWEFHSRQYMSLVQQLEQVAEASHLPDEPLPGSREDLNELLIRLRRW